VIDKIAPNMKIFSNQLVQLGVLIDADTTKVIRLMILKLFRNIILRSPVDTGAYRASHGIVCGRMPANKEGLKEGKGFVGIKGTDFDFDLDDKFVVIFNNQPYAERLEEGYSKQAPSGIYSMALAESNKLFAEVLKSFKEFSV